MSTRGYGLYLHVPFCGSVCSYCHFSRTADHNFSQRSAYVDSVGREMDLRLEQCSVLSGKKRELATAYIGGGTPSQLENKLMAQLVQGTVNRLPRSEGLEFTAEANPETFDQDKAALWRDLGINRLSLGVQSLSADVLQLLGRSCDPAAARRALALAGKTFARVSADWIIGPGLQEDSLRQELSEALDLGVRHFSLYILEVHSHTQLERDLAVGKAELPGDSLTERLYLAAGEHLEKNGVRQYEVANFAVPGQESRHNQNYWRAVPWLALGPSAHGYWGRQRYANLDDPAEWAAALARDELPVAQVDPLNLSARKLEKAVLALRTAEGLPLAWIPADTFDLARGERDRWWQIKEDRLVLTRLGFLRIDSLEERLVGRF